jgi:putative aldouronate transport system permease protein
MVSGHRTARFRAFDVANYLLMAIVAAVTLYPMLYVLTMSLSRIEDIMKSTVQIFPRRPTLEAFRYVFSQSGILTAYRNTLFITVIGTALNLVMTSLGAYVLSKRYLPGRGALTAFVLVSMVFNGGLIPYYLVVKALGLTGSRWALIVPSAINTFYLIIMRNFFAAIPASLEESARIEGASEFRVLLQVVLPLSFPVLSTIGLFYAVFHWNEYFAAIIFLSKGKLMPLQVLIRSMYQNATDMMMFDALPPPTESIKAATIIIATVPILCVYPFLQRYFVKGIMIGAVKG